MITLNDKRYLSESAHGYLQPDETLIFLHLAKTAGTTVFKMLGRNYTDQTIFRFGKRPGLRLTDLQNLPFEQKAGLKLIHGHSCFGIHEHLTQPYRYITFLREPVARVISEYYFKCHHPHRPAPDDYAHCQTLRQYLDLDSELNHVDNHQTRRIVGAASNQFKFGECTEELLEVAKQNLFRFLMVGITERFDESLIVLRHFASLKNLLYVRSNENQSKPKLTDIDADDIEYIKKFNELDQELYIYANQLLENQISNLGERFEIEHSLFREGNIQFGDTVTELSVKQNSSTEVLKKTRDQLKRLRAKQKQSRNMSKQQRNKLKQLRNKLKQPRISSLARMNPLSGKIRRMIGSKRENLSDSVSDK